MSPAQRRRWPFALGRAAGRAELRSSAGLVIRVLGGIVLAYVGCGVLGALLATATDLGPEPVLLGCLPLLALLLARPIAGQG